MIQSNGMSQKMLTFTVITCLFIMVTMVYINELVLPGFVFLYHLSVYQNVSPANITQPNTQVRKLQILNSQPYQGKETQMPMNQSKHKAEKRMNQSGLQEVQTTKLSVNNTQHNKIMNVSENPNLERNQSTILFWTFNFLTGSFGRPKKGFWNFDCHPYHCRFTNNRNYLSDSAAVLFDPVFSKGKNFRDMQ